MASRRGGGQRPPSSLSNEYSELLSTTDNSNTNDYDNPGNLLIFKSVGDHSLILAAEEIKIDDGEGDETRDNSPTGEKGDAEEAYILKSPEVIEHLKILLSPHDLGNFGIMASYFSIGMVLRITQAPVQYYLIEYLYVSATIYSANNAFHRIPWTLKFIFGMLSDAVPILGYRRKPWMTIGWLAFVLLSLTFAAIGTPGVYTTIFIVFLAQCFLVLADVVTDTLCVERANYEQNHIKGNLQATGYIYKAVGKVIGGILGTYLYDNGTVRSFDIGDMFILQAAVPLVCLSIFLWPLLEFVPFQTLPSFEQQLNEVWRVLQLRAVWKPMIFIYVFDVMQIPNSAWSNFLVWGLNFNNKDLGYLTIASSVIGGFGYVIYRTFLFEVSWRKVYIASSLVAFFFTSMQIILVLRLNVQWGIPDVVFAVGDQILLVLSENIHTMPHIIMFIMLCPEGAEGTTFALLTTISSLAGTVSSSIGTYLTSIWDVSNTALSAGDFDGIMKLTILTSILQTLPIVLVFLIPENRVQHQREIDRSITNWWAGFILAMVILCSLVFTLAVNFSLLF